MEAHRSRTMGDRLRAFWRTVRHVVAETHEAQQRLWLLNHPWEERMLHWSHDGEDVVLHGEFAARDARPRAVTSGGWCLAHSRQRQVEAHER